MSDRPSLLTSTRCVPSPVQSLRTIGCGSLRRAPTLVLFVLSAALFVLQGAARGGSLEALFSQHRLFNKPLQRAVQAAARRYRPEQIDAALLHAALVDRAIKGVHRADPWEEFLRLGSGLHDLGLR